ncbi:MAG: type I-B CRISPR-associated protein Cas8b1/Cst1 [Spirochaetales bacterium]|nr:type I-B CRISPR-associated protein Cas8b1/Cst1 [Spirochaetales bacterium]
MQIRIFLRDWYFNAGIAGFLRIVSDDAMPDDLCKVPGLQIGENYIEFDLSILKGFSERFFVKAHDQYGRTKRAKEQYTEWLNDSKAFQKDPEKIKTKYKITDDGKKAFEEIILERYKTFTCPKLLRDNMDPPDRKTIKNKPGELIKFLEDNISFLENNKQEVIESEAKIYLSGMGSQKSFLNRAITGGYLTKFKDDFESAIVGRENTYEKKLLCLIDPENPAKKNTHFDTGLSPFLGGNKDAVNFFWIFKMQLPIGEIPELIYFCTFAGFTDTSRGKEKHLLFVNQDSSVSELYRENKLLARILSKDPANILVEFFTELLLQEKTKKAEYILRNIALIEVENPASTFPKVHAFNISLEKAEYINEKQETLKKLSKSNFVIKDKREYLLPLFLTLFLKDKLDFSFLYRLTRYFLTAKQKEGYVKTIYNANTLQNLTILLSRYFEKIIKRRTMMEIGEKDLWRLFYKGADLSNLLMKKDMKNKIPSIAYKLLGSLHAGEPSQFMFILSRIYMAHEIEFPKDFVRILNDKDIFQAFGYSFVNGLLQTKKPANAGKGDTT